MRHKSSIIDKIFRFAGGLFILLGVTLFGYGLYEYDRKLPNLDYDLRYSSRDVTFGVVKISKGFTYFLG